MLFGILLFVLVLAVAFFHYTQGLFSATISAIISVIAALLAVSFYEPLAEKFFMGKFADYGHASALVILFAGIYLALRVAFDSLIPGNVRFYPLLNNIGGGAMGLIAGIMTAGVVAIAAQAMPFGPSIMMWSRFETEDKEVVVRSQQGRSRDGFVSDSLTSATLSTEAESNIPLLASDRIVLGLVSTVSNGGSLAGANALDDVHPNLLWSYYGQRIGIQPGASHVAINSDSSQHVMLQGLYRLTSVEQVPAEPIQGLDRRVERKQRTPVAGKMLLVARVVFDLQATDGGNLVRVSPGSVQLVVPGDGQEPGQVYFPVGVMHDNGRMFGESADAFLFASPDKPLDLVFEVDENAMLTSRTPDAETGKLTVKAGVNLVVKRAARIDLSDNAVEAGYGVPFEGALIRRETAIQQLNPPATPGQ